jgi:hypothetical protein
VYRGEERRRERERVSKRERESEREMRREKERERERKRKKERKIRIARQKHEACCVESNEERDKRKLMRHKKHKSGCLSLGSPH